MQYRHPLPVHLQARALGFAEFANGGAQATARLRDGHIFKGLLISNGAAIIAIRGAEELPFSVSEIEDLYQTTEDANPQQRSGWHFWDQWK